MPDVGSFPGSTRAAPSRVSAVLAGAGIAVVALLTAPAAALVSRMCWRIGGHCLPYGLGLSAAGSMGVVVLARSVSRQHAFVAAVSWLVGLGFVMRSPTGGGFLVAGDGLGWAFLALDTAGVLTCALWAGRRS